MTYFELTSSKEYRHMMVRWLNANEKYLPVNNTTAVFNFALRNMPVVTSSITSIKMRVNI